VTAYITTVSAMVISTALAASVAIAQDNPAGRYTMHKSDDGFVRLDTQTGAVAVCQKSESGWGCKDMAGASGKPAGDDAALRAENKELKAEIGRMEELLGLRGGSGKRRGDTRYRDTFKLPSEQEVDQALNYFERMLKKFQDRLKRLEKKSDKPAEQL
jgi:hypothetical protein